MADFADEDGLAGGVAAAVKLEITVADHLDQFGAKGLGRAAEDDVAGGIGGVFFGGEFPALFIHDAFAANDDHIFLEVVSLFDTLDQPLQVQRMFGNENNVGAAVGGAERKKAGVASHDLNDGNAAMAFGRRAQ